MQNQKGKEPNQPVPQQPGSPERKKEKKKRSNDPVLSSTAPPEQDMPLEEEKKRANSVSAMDTMILEKGKYNLQTDEEIAAAAELRNEMSFEKKRYLSKVPKEEKPREDPSLFSKLEESVRPEETSRPGDTRGQRTRRAWGNLLPGLDTFDPPESRSENKPEDLPPRKPVKGFWRKVGEDLGFRPRQSPDDRDR